MNSCYTFRNHLYFSVDLWFNIITFAHFSTDFPSFFYCFVERSFLHFKESCLCLWLEFEGAFYTLRILAICDTNCKNYFPVWWIIFVVSAIQKFRHFIKLNCYQIYSFIASGYCIRYRLSISMQFIKNSPLWFLSNTYFSVLHFNLWSLYFVFS